jgi:hypothetical protein
MIDFLDTHHITIFRSARLKSNTSKFLSKNSGVKIKLGLEIIQNKEIRKNNKQYNMRAIRAIRAIRARKTGTCSHARGLA